MDRSDLRILVPLDGSDEAEQVLETIRPLARSGSLTLLHAGGADRAETLRRELVEAEIPCFVRSAEDRLETAIAREATGHDLVALSLRPWEPIACGSPVPFLITGPDPGTSDWSRIVVPLDGFPAAEQVLPLASRLAVAMDATLHLLRISLPLLPYDDHLGLLPLPPTDRCYLESVAQRLAARRVRTVLVELAGAPAREIARYAVDVGAGLIAMASEECADRSAPVSHSVAEQVVRSTSCPVLIERLPRRERPATRYRTAQV